MQNLIDAVKSFKSRWLLQGRLSLDQLKKKYNRLIEEQKRFAAELDDPTIPEEVRRQKTPEYKRLLHRLNLCIRDIESQGIEMTHEEVMGGFG